MSRKPNPVPFPDHADPEKAQARVGLATSRQAPPTEGKAN